jgi:hypothetical protein
LLKLSFEFIDHSQALISIDPVRARDDPVVVKNVPYYKAKKTLEAEVMKLDPPPRPQNWGVSIRCTLWLQTSMHVHILTYYFNRERKKIQLVSKALTITYTTLQ